MNGPADRGPFGSLWDFLAADEAFARAVLADVGGDDGLSGPAAEAGFPARPADLLRRLQVRLRRDLEADLAPCRDPPRFVVVETPRGLEQRLAPWVEHVHHGVDTEALDLVNLSAARLRRSPAWTDQ